MAKIIYTFKPLDATIFQSEDGTYFVRKGEEELPAQISLSKDSAPSLSVRMAILAKKELLAFRKLEGNVIEFYEKDQPTNVPEQVTVPSAPPSQRQKKKLDIVELFVLAAENGDSVQLSVTEAPMDAQMRPVCIEISRSDSELSIAKVHHESEFRLKKHQIEMENTLGMLEISSKLQIETIERSTANRCKIIKQNMEKRQASQDLNIMKMRITTDNHLAKIAAENEYARMKAEIALKDTIITEEAFIEKQKFQTDYATKTMQRDYLRQKAEGYRKT